jgi:8-oxo-dGTP diphosphatase
MAATDGLLQFGEKTSADAYRPRQGAYGILVRDGRIAVVQVGYTKFTYDLPGGGIEAGETPEAALTREYLEETGLEVKVGGMLAEFNHYMVHDDGTPYNNHARVYEVEFVRERPQAKVEDDHELIWLPPLEVIKRLKREGYGWAMVRWIRRET